MPHIVGTGLLALDVIVQRNGASVSYSASGGGTCGNVLTILARMGWQSSWLGAMDDSSIARLIRHEMESAGVCLHSTPSDDAPPTPVFAHHIDVDAHGHARHWFSDSCPHCGRKFPHYQRPADTWLTNQVAHVRRADVFFADRLSDSIIELAAQAKAHGALIVYEPSASSDLPWMGQMFALADIVKHSSDRRNALEGVAAANASTLWIETLGSRGLRWSFDRNAHHEIAAVPNPRAIDACGAGDWFTSALIFLLSGTSQKLSQLTPTQLTRVMKTASGVAAWSCSFLGARGALYDAPIHTVFEQMQLAPLTHGAQLLRRPPAYSDALDLCAFA
ncbi:PfkB family carbohydrate kinase [Pseudoxanthomonas sacheonensis]|uniref:PfkB family carbohydrate kinase n=1 Tax=Pseudoxanthomonas sacheonensis TaxID=443615 RepID=UPI0013D05431|nr:PfkB family carbohydrate kinase [Pseudoxanthomonas sacheonensis]KAF1710164.1 hypothetical protein CSC73_05665 [Pseudoxanthomonas sacheonensis]